MEVIIAEIYLRKGLFKSGCLFQKGRGLYIRGKVLFERGGDYY